MLLLLSANGFLQCFTQAASVAYLAFNICCFTAGQQHESSRESYTLSNTSSSIDTGI
jgi:hypothetical protein